MALTFMIFRYAYFSIFLLLLEFEKGSRAGPQETIFSGQANQPQSYVYEWS